MAYQKRYEDSYLDDEDEDIDGIGKTDAERLLELVAKKDRTDKENQRMQKLTERLFTAAKMPAAVGSQAIAGLELVARAYETQGSIDIAIELWARLADIGISIGDKELYYRATEEISNLGPDMQ